jgi:peptide methionine sulfoxide reductase MsrA
MPEPTYRALGDHSEAIEIGFDPERITYERLLLEVFAAHSPTAEPWSRQYRSAIFVHDDAQRAAAELAVKAEEKKRDVRIHTAIEEAGTFWQAEDYHQKYRLRAYDGLLAEARQVYPETDDLVMSTLAARLNAWAAGWGDEVQVAREIELTGLSDAAREKVLALAGRP